MHMHTCTQSRQTKQGWAFEQGLEEGMQPPRGGIHDTQLLELSKYKPHILIAPTALAALAASHRHVHLPLKHALEHSSVCSEEAARRRVLRQPHTTRMQHVEHVERASLQAVS